MICPTFPVEPELPEISTLSVGMYWTPSRISCPDPAMLMVLFLLALQVPGSSKGGEVGTKQPGSLTTRTEMRIGGVGPISPLVCTGLPAQSIAAVAGAPPPNGGGNLVPAFRAMVSALFPLKMQDGQLPGPASLNIRATPGKPGSYPPTRRPEMFAPLFR